MESHKQVTADVLVHAASKRYYNVYLTVMYMHRVLVYIGRSGYLYSVDQLLREATVWCCHSVLRHY
jgi:hypothetical protein